MTARDARGRFAPASPRGARRPKDGARDLLGERFAAALAKDFARHGARVIEALRAERPADYLKLVAALQPKEAKAEGRIEELSDAELDERIERLALALGFKLGKGRARRPADGEEA